MSSKKELNTALIRNGDIVLFHTKGSLISWAIRSITHSNFNHTAQVVNGWVIVHALFKGVIWERLSKYVTDSKYQLTVVYVDKEAFIDEGEYIKALWTVEDRANRAVGKKYDFNSLVGILLLAIAKKIGLNRLFPKKNPLNKRKKFFCSELIAEIWKDTSSKVEHLFGGQFYIDGTTPHDIYKSKWTLYRTGWIAKNSS